MNIFKTFRYLTVFILLFFLASCEKPEAEVYEEPEADFSRAVAVIQPLNDSGVSGLVYFDITSTGVEVIADIDGLKPGEYGFHIHEYGDIRDVNGKSLGGHFNPANKNHGTPNSETSHAGDMPNLVVMDDSTAHLEFTNSKISFSGKESIIGRGLVIHAMEDDYSSQPSGNAGKRIACGVIGIANPGL